jgi:hypothetical protein
MKTSKITLGLFILIILITVNNASAQEKGKCTATATNIYFVDSGTSVTEVHPGSNGGNGYQLNIIGDGDSNFEVVQERYMVTLSFVRVYDNPPQAKWQMFFAPNMGRIIPTIRMKNKCTGETQAYKLDSKVKLLDQ